MYAAMWLIPVIVGADDRVLPVTAAVTKSEIEFRAGDELVTRYHFGVGVAKPYWMPLNLNGINLTRDRDLPRSSTDHPHQRSAWLGHGEILPEGLTEAQATPGLKAIDFWSERDGHGVIECVKVDAPRLYAGAAVVATNNVWKARDGTAVLLEERTIRVEATKGSRRIVVTSELKPAGSAVTFGDTKEGTFGVRVSDALRYSDGGLKVLNGGTVISNAAGARGEMGCWGRFADWCDVSGELGGRRVGITVFDHSANRPRACWHVRGYGLLAANPFGRTRAGFPDRRGKPEPLVRLESGESLRLSYAIFLHEGDAVTGRVAEECRQFSAAAP